MQNYEQILAELGIEIPEDKKSDLKKKMDENYRTKSDYDKVVTKRDEYKTSLDDVQAFFVTSDYAIHYTKDFQKEITVTETD